MPREIARRGANTRTDSAESASSRPVGGRGWSGYGEQKSAVGDFPENFKVPNAPDRTVFRFVEDGPFWSYRQHWIERSGKKSFTCLGEDCPLCDSLGDKPRLQVLFNVIEFTESGPALKIWAVGSRVANQIKAYNEDLDLTGPVNRGDLYWRVNKSGKGTSTVTSLSVIKERDLLSDFKLEPLSEDEIADFENQKYDESVVNVQSAKELQDIADEVG